MYIWGGLLSGTTVRQTKHYPRGLQGKHAADGGQDGDTRGPLSRSENQNGGLPAIESRGKHLTDAKRVSAFRNGGGQPRRGESRRHCFFCAGFSVPPCSVRVTRRDSSAGPVGSPLLCLKLQWAPTESAALPVTLLPPALPPFSPHGCHNDQCTCLRICQTAY